MSAASLKRHVANKHSARVPWAEPVCWMQFRDGPAVAAHLRSMHSREPAMRARGVAHWGLHAEAKSFTYPEPGCKRVFSRPPDVAALVVAAHGDDDLRFEIRLHSRLVDVLDVYPATVESDFESQAAQDVSPANV